MSIDKLAKKIKLIIFDVDGVLTDGGLYFTDEGTEFKRFNSLDGHGIKLLKENGIEPAVISARNSKSVNHRMKNLGVKHFYQGQSNKVVAFNELLEKLHISADEVAYMGDDVIDLPVMTKVGFAIAVANAHDLVKQNANLITQKNGGQGAVREVCDFILKAQGKFDKAMAPYLQ
ncbi:3-deoxy-D-manno-octulosonate 8-phosphate phosphatase [Bathymodiolus thermophilus thioautotrophic gill symbiont]|uniref:3-deoxy-D-manno-octulosonate 8-phosphate phosphatase KdsC n=3 Tax=Bathymodiolus thermophilus thioautotrophic gill symbiont TaxID=2360 RepID=A0A1J5TVJ3_9GAMM|nr:3-deoxy-manno-octulosonate-8-phosphatase KdsC [Bathymodiolus thermophilus thioautotrophic gill symbiont]OIR24196.1 phenylphosphate carboxylase subunit delta [Bathymodiolus thermophilus thioautotrophic gill symbiont]CAB5500842.1 3-deoxy-D-manno-octulosonate 8-phosphate phosphatase (EC [Bathymodiolus thermophilus thioautotrophic gill symbiont]SHA14593.1 3-deoxy-D-manno-octulosonate 8-phosphate phosphatase [Bathymodiolus thermophilus thioautotrophic gill symbiont]